MHKFSRPYIKKRLRKEFDVESRLELEFEKYYKKFIITRARGGETGAKKRYAGLKEEEGRDVIEFVGMESVRSDWTRLAKDFQAELYKRIFAGGEVEEWIRALVNEVKEGKHNDKLIYRKRLRKEAAQYIKSAPPHVKAARKAGIKKGYVKYIITRNGPEPVDNNTDDIDYEHYVQRQLKPVADSVLELMGLSFDGIIGGNQMELFGK